MLELEACFINESIFMCMASTLPGHRFHVEFSHECAFLRPKPGGDRFQAPNLWGSELLLTVQYHPFYKTAQSDLVTLTSL